MLRYKLFRLNTPTDIMAANLYEKLSEMFSSLKADDGDDEEEEEEEVSLQALFSDHLSL